MSAGQDFVIPDALRQTRAGMAGIDGPGWLGRLPGVVVECVRRWSLDLRPAFAGLSYNYAAPGTRSDGSAVVLKVCYPDAEFYTEVEALRLFDGRGSLRLIEADLDQGAMLLERLCPGTPLTYVADVEEQARIAAGVMRELWRPLPARHGLPSLDAWMGGMGTKAPDLVPGSGLPYAAVERALSLYADLAASAGPSVVLHGDLHQGNILAAQGPPWVAIDPKGITGPPIWETGPLLLNLLPTPEDSPANRRLLDRFVAHLANELGFSTVEVKAWGVVRAVLSSFWSLEDSGTAWDAALALAGMLD